MHHRIILLPMSDCANYKSFISIRESRFPQLGNIWLSKPKLLFVLESNKAAFPYTLCSVVKTFSCFVFSQPIWTFPPHLVLSECVWGMAQL